MLAIAPLAFDSIFLVSFCFAMLGLGILLLLVNGRDRAPGAVAPERPPRSAGPSRSRARRATVLS